MAKKNEPKVNLVEVLKEVMDEIGRASCRERV